MEKRRLGRTNLQVSIIGFGGTWIAELCKSEAVKVVRHAFNLGMNYFDTAPLDGDSEEKIGIALEDVREQCVIATKTSSRTKKESLKDFKSSLKRLRTDHLDIIQLHGIDDERTLNKAMSYDGSLQTCKEAQREGLVDFIGITGHKPLILSKAIKTGVFDTVLVPLNILTRQALEELIPTAKKNDVGVVIMKPFMLKTSNLITCLYQPSLSLISDEPELKNLLGETIHNRAESALRYVLSQNISVVISGLKSISEVENATKVGNQYHGLTDQEKEKYTFNLIDHCRDCGLCMPCPEDINIAAILRFYSLHQDYELKDWAKKLYSGLEIKADKCTSCRICQPKCPYNLPICKQLKKAHCQLNLSC